MAEQGPWTDIYATAGVAYKLISGITPPDAPSRIDSELSGRPDPCAKLEDDTRPGFDKSFLRAVDRAMAIRATDRPQSIKEWRKELGMDGAAAPAGQNNKAGPAPAGLEQTVLFERQGNRPVPQQSGGVAAAGAGGTASTAKTSSSIGPILGGVSVLAIAAIGGWYAFTQMEKADVEDIGDTIETARELGTLTATEKTIADSLGGDDQTDIVRFKLTRPRLVEVDTTELPSDVTLDVKQTDGSPQVPLRDGKVFKYLLGKGEQTIALNSKANSSETYELTVKAVPLTSDTDAVEITNKRPPTIDLSRSTPTTRSGILWANGEERKYRLKNPDTTKVTVTFDPGKSSATLNIINSQGLGLGRIDGKSGPLVTRLPAGDHDLIATSHENAPLSYNFTLTPARVSSRITTETSINVPGYFTPQQANLAAKHQARAELVNGGKPPSRTNASAAEINMASLEKGIPFDEKWTISPNSGSTISAKLEARVRRIEKPDDFRAALSETTIRAMEPFDVRMSSNASETLFLGVYAWGADGNVVRVFPIGVNTSPLALPPRSNSKLSDKVDRLISAPLPGQSESEEAVIIASCPIEADFVGLAPPAGADVGQSIALAVGEEDFFEKLSAFCPGKLGLRVLPYTVVEKTTP
ncbi:MAG: hypothetical protein AAFO75_04265 [Pseudomonadota bacterium]